MIIRSSFHDYYDPVAKAYRDPEPVYARETVITPSSYSLKDPIPWGYFWGGRGVGRVHSCGLIWFCGQSHPYIRANEFCHNADDALNQIRAKWIGGKMSERTYWEMNRHLDRDVRGYFDRYRRENLVKLTTAPVFHIYEEDRRYMISHNPCLKDLDFQRIQDPHQAFQEINMFLMNQTLPGREMKKLTNNELIESHGFDLKKSFRKPSNEIV